MLPTFALPACALLRMRMSAPPQPIATPNAFFHVIGSLRMKKESTMAKIGIDVVTMLALTGEVMLSPMLYSPWLNTMPSRAASANFTMSRTGICSRGPISEATQKSRAAPTTRNDTTEMPSKPLFIAALPTGVISPQMASAANILKCACKGTRLSFIFYL